jgi:integrase
MLLFARNWRKDTFKKVGDGGLRYKPGQSYALDDGGSVIATEAELIYLDDRGRITKRERNQPVVLVEIEVTSDEQKTFFTRKADKPDQDAKILESWIEHRNIKPRERDQARKVFALFKTLVPKPLAKCTRADGLVLVKHLQEQGHKGATIGKKVGYLRAASHLAIKWNLLQTNPFADIVPKMDDEEERPALNDADMALARDHLDGLDDQDRLLWIMLACTGMRLSEAFSITAEETTQGIRFVRVGFGTRRRKTNSSKRRVPLPQQVLPLLPSKIEGPLFPDDTTDAASKRLNRFIDKSGIEDPTKVLHGLRHRAIARLRELRCDEQTTRWLVGHGEFDVHDKYGEGRISIHALKEAVDMIGY